MTCASSCRQTADWLVRAILPMYHNMDSDRMSTLRSYALAVLPCPAYSWGVSSFLFCIQAPWKFSVVFIPNCKTAWKLPNNAVNDKWRNAPLGLGEIPCSGWICVDQCFWSLNCNRFRKQSATQSPCWLLAWTRSRQSSKAAAPIYGTLLPLNLLIIKG